MSGILQWIGGESQSRYNARVMVAATALLTAVFAAQYYFARQGIEREVHHRAESALHAKSGEIEKELTAVEAAVQNLVWAGERLAVVRPDSLYRIVRRIVIQNDLIVGSAIAFVPDYFTGHPGLYSPYCFEDELGRLHEKQLDTEAYDYPVKEWFEEPLRTGKPHWSEPYYDNGGGEMMMTTYSMPMHDAAGRVIGVLTADLSLGWIGEDMREDMLYPHSYVMVLSREGRLIAYPDSTKLLKLTVNNLDDTSYRDPRVTEMNEAMMRGESGEMHLHSVKGEPRLAVYSRLRGDSQWSMAVIVPEDEAYAPLRTQSMVQLLAMLVGLGLLAFIMLRSARNARQLQAAAIERERLDSELNVARDIQMGMLPRGSALPCRADVAVAAALAPAREVGGDLYDCFVRDEKLFFAIGDVSGKGVPAAMVMAMMTILFRSLSRHMSSPAHIMQQMNAAATDNDETGIFVTMLVGVLDLPTGRLRYCNAGHNPPLLLHDGGVSELPVVANIALGVVGDYQFTGQEATLPAGAALLLYTDGVTEAMNPQHALYGDERLLAVARQAAAQGGNPDPDGLVRHVRSQVREFAAGAEQSDDLTVMAVAYTPAKRQVVLSRSLTLTGGVEQVTELNTFVEATARELGFDDSQVMSLKLAIEEMAVNVFTYAYPHGHKATVKVDVLADDEWFDVALTDGGRAFDPTVAPQADTTLPTEERPIGGLGIFLARQLMDSINYERVDQHNVLTMRKRRHPATATTC